MNTCYVVRSSRPAGLFSFGLLDGLQVRLRRPYLREAPAGFGLKRLATVFMNNPGYQRAENAGARRSLTGLHVWDNRSTPRRIAGETGGTGETRRKPNLSTSRLSRMSRASRATLYGRW
jgi:hypothetical protein